MKQKLQCLLEFQGAELEIEKRQGILDAIPEKIETLVSRKNQLESEFEKEKAAIDALKKRYREMESKVQDNTNLIKKSDEKLTAVKTNKEYQAILKEIDDFKEKNSGIEDEMITCLEDMDNAETQIAEKNEVLKQILAQLSAEIESLKKEAEEEKSRLEEAQRLRGTRFRDVDAAMMADYERIKKIVINRPVVAVSRSVCQGCHLNIPPQMFIELQRGGQLNFCPHCDRIIYWDELIGE
jgi:predicted  nucleic acid-binding Zn-ribbon protein